jgi:hypothetical protein
MKKEKKQSLLEEKILENILMIFLRKKICGKIKIKENFLELLMKMKI